MTKRRRNPLSLRKKLLFSLLTTLGFFVVLEGALALIGVQPEATTTDRWVGFSAYHPLMETIRDAEGNPWLQTSAGKSHWFNYQKFPRTKQPNTQRIFCMGGSTTYGHPYWDSTSFAGWLREFLPIVDPERKWEVINAGGISYASYRVAALMEELAEYEPDLFIVFSAHNEFLERRTYANMFDRSPTALAVSALLSKTRTWKLIDQAVQGTLKHTPASPAPADILPGEVDEILNHTIGPVDYHRDPLWQRQVMQHYRDNLRRMVVIARRASAKIVFVTPASNDKDCSPFKSQLPPQFDSDQRQQFNQMWQEAELFIERTDDLSAYNLLEQARRLDPDHADVNYQLGKVALRLGKDTEAEAALVHARDVDVCPLRATSEITKMVMEVANEANVPVVDFLGRLSAVAQAEQGRAVLGGEYFLDHVHPTIAVHRQLASWIIEELQSQSWVSGRSIHDESLATRLMQARLEVMNRLDQRAEAGALRNLAKVLHWAGKYAEALPRAEDTLELLPGDPESLYLVASCSSHLGQTERALAVYAELFADGIGFPRAYQAYGELLAKVKQFEQAKAYLLLAILRNSENASAYASLGLVHLHLGEIEFAREALQEARKLSPNDPEIEAAIGQLPDSPVSGQRHIESAAGR